MSKSQAVNTIKDTLAHLRTLPDHFGYIAADVDTLHRAFVALRNTTTTDTSQIESLRAEIAALRKKQEEHESEVSKWKARATEAEKTANDAIGKVNKAMRLAENVVCFHDNFRMESLETKMGEHHHALKRKCIAIAKECSSELRKRRGGISPDFIMNMFHKNLEAVQRCAQAREDMLYDACRNSVISFGLFLCAAIDANGPITLDDKTRLNTLEFTVDGSFPNVTVRACKPNETATTEIKLTEGIKALAQRVLMEFRPLEERNDED